MPYTFHPAGEMPAVYTPGDIFVVRDWVEDKIGALIQARERAVYGKTAWANLTHSGCIVSASGQIVEANRPGIERKSIEKYRQADLYVIHVNASLEQRALCVKRWEAQVGTRYDILDFVGLGLQTLLGWNVSIHSFKRFICSGLCCYGALAYVVDFAIPAEAMTPADIAHHFGLAMGEPPSRPSFFSRFLDRLVTVAKVLTPF